jgi:hypothetical protein
VNTIVLAVPRGAPRREGPSADADDMRRTWRTTPCGM